MAFVIRRFETKDLEMITNINRRCLPENYTAFFFMDLHNRFPATFVVTEENGEVIGYIMCRIEPGLTDFATLGLTRKGHVISIAVLPEHRRRGIAYALMREAMQAMLLYKAKECFLEVRVNNASAVNLYKKMGFKVKRTIRSYYADGEDAYRMVRKLPFEAHLQKA